MSPEATITDTDNLLETETLTVSREGHVAQILLTRPDQLNSCDARLHRDFPAALVTLRGQSDVRAVVFGSTGKVFSAGGDFDYLHRIYEDLTYRQAVLEEGCRTFLELSDFPVPIVAAVQGDAMGWGASMVFGCDAVVAARAARFADPHVRIGLVGGDGGCVMWPQAAGLIRAKRHLLTGDPLTAEDAFTMGLVTDLVDDADQVLPTAHALAARIASLPPLAVRGTKRVLNRIMQQRGGEVLELGVFIEGVTAGSDDMMEAIAAFREKRGGVYSGR
jgi:enoyl-CoA hydratase